MSSTRRLFGILLLILSVFCLYLTIINYNDVTTYVNKIVRKYSKNNVVVPNYTKNHRLYIFKSVKETTNFEPQNIEDLKNIYFTVLNNGWETFTFYCPYDYENCVNDVKQIANSKNDDYITLINNYVSPYNSYRRYNTTIVDDNKITLSVDKLYDADEIVKINNVLDPYINKNFNKKNITLKDIEKLHDYLISKITYDNDYKIGDEITDSNKATGAVLKGVALCSGYSDAFAIALDKINIPNFKINSAEHEWNVIYFNNKWSHIDLTWDDDEINKNNNRNFFMIDTKTLYSKDKKDHLFAEDYYLELK